MIARIALAAALVAAAAVAFWHPAPRNAIETVPAAATVFRQPFDKLRVTPGAAKGGTGRAAYRSTISGDLVVYVAGAVERPGLYHLHLGDRYARAVELAGGLSPQADAAAVNLAQPATDGDEVDVPVAGQASHAHSRARSRRRRPPAPVSVDINAANAAELGGVPGIGHAVAERVIALRDREGPFASLDELLDVAGMTQSRLERARPYLRPP